MMPFDRDDYRRTLVERAEEGKDALKHNLQVMDRAALEARSVTNDPHWDHFLSYIQAAIETTEAQMQQLHRQLADDARVTHESLLLSKLALKRCEGRLEAFRAVQDLPKDLIASGDEARAVLDRLTDSAA
jgi:hypothetical protein